MLSEFAQRQMRLSGWEEGKGLGKKEDGMKEALKVKMKVDNAGVGHDPGEQFTFHWWEHVFAKSAKNIRVEEAESGVVVKTEGETMISTKKTNRKTSLPKSSLYGNFVKSSTLENGKETRVEKVSSSESDTDDEKDAKKFAALTDEQLLEACGGRTAHKGARHGVTLSGKLERLERQESSVSEDGRKAGKKGKKRKAESKDVEPNCDKIKKKKKKSKNEKDYASQAARAFVVNEENSIKPGKKSKKKKRDKKREKQN